MPHRFDGPHDPFRISAMVSFVMGTPLLSMAPLACLIMWFCTFLRCFRDSSFLAGAAPSAASAGAAGKPAKSPAVGGGDDPDAGVGVGCVPTFGAAAPAPAAPPSWSTFIFFAFFLDFLASFG
mmetsp:Transcript_43307/g.134114  ORF Transcript_43307/g.134114 Transcript_43307/m.134114 type:complete len:123 (-) Transcript_43307:256-624(-)